MRLRYNSAVFGVTTGQDYKIYFINASHVSTTSAWASTKSNLTNKKWKSLYDTQYVPNVGDLYLIIDEFGLGAKLDLDYSPSNWSYLPTSEIRGAGYPFIPGPIWPHVSNISVDITLDATNIIYSYKQPSSILTFNVEAYNSSNMPELTWTDFVFINSSTNYTWRAGISIDDYGWLSTASPRNQSLGNTMVHVSYGLSTHVPYSSSIQIAQVFVVVVIICNFLKTVAIFFILQNSFSQQILTLGDAVSSYLASPDLSTLGACILDKKKLNENISHGEKYELAQWRRHKVHYLLGIISNGWITYLIL